MTSRPVIISVVLHIALAVLFAVGLPSIKRKLPEEQPIIAMEIVQTVPISNLTEGSKASTAKEAQEPAKRKNTPPPPPPKAAPKSKPVKPVAPAKPKPVTPPKAPDKTAEIIPEKSKPKPKVKPKPAPVKAPTPPTKKPQSAETVAAPTKLPKAPPRRENKMAKASKQKQKQAQALTGVMQNLAKAKQINEDAEKKRREQERKEAAEKVNKTLTATTGNALKAPKAPVIAPMGPSDFDRLRAHLSKCWDLPVGSAGADTLIVDIIVTSDRDGTVLSAEIKDKTRYKIDRAFKAAAAEAQRATLECSPLPLPPEKYEQWKSFIFAFDPRSLSR
ncbi:cell envelope integrity protein TolA [Alphaproteobacteria bacterium]|nr:cell envelope integrity protein TolA [Alphaproteobacteria bacterium]